MAALSGNAIGQKKAKEQKGGYMSETREASPDDIFETGNQVFVHFEDFSGEPDAFDETDSRSNQNRRYPEQVPVKIKTPLCLCRQESTLVYRSISPIIRKAYRKPA